jgi:hypothetical protein
MRQRADGLVLNNARVVENLLEFGGRRLYPDSRPGYNS